MSVALLLNPTWPASFRRTIRDESGKVVRSVLFERSEPVVLEDDEFIALHDDIGKALCYAAVGHDGVTPLSKPAADQGHFDDLKPKKRKK